MSKLQKKLKAINAETQEIHEECAAVEKEILELEKRPPKPNVTPTNPYAAKGKKGEKAGVRSSRPSPGAGPKGKNVIVRPSRPSLGAGLKVGGRLSARRHKILESYPAIGGEEEERNDCSSSSSSSSDDSDLLDIGIFALS